MSHFSCLVIHEKDVDLRGIELEINGVDVPNFQLDVAGNGFAAHLGDLAVGDVAKITYTATVRDAALAGTSVVNTAYLDADTIGEPLRDDAFVTILGDEPAIELAKSVDKDKVHVGDTVTYTVSAIANDAAENVVIADTSLPAGMPIEKLSRWLGHKSPNITREFYVKQRYMNLNRVKRELDTALMTAYNS